MNILELSYYISNKVKEKGEKSVKRLEISDHVNKKI